MKRRALIIFIRNAVPGKVKTRIARVAGDAEALRIYKALLLHTRNISIPLQADKFVFYSHFMEHDDLWEEEIFQKRLQSGETLGDRMMEAFRLLFENGYEKIVIIGSDCYELTTPLLESAFSVLEEKDAVIGPARDGGYYLLGMKGLIPELFKGKEWSTSTVFRQTVEDLDNNGLTWGELPMLSDVDTLEDVPGELLPR